MTCLIVLSLLLVASSLPMWRRRPVDVLDLFDGPDDVLVCCPHCCRVHSARRGCP